MNNAYLWIIGLVLLSIVVGGVIAFFEIRSAPEGFEDSEGFHPTVARGAGISVEEHAHHHRGAVSLAT